MSTLRDPIEARSEAEAISMELLGHTYRCAHCWPWRDVLWQADRLCDTGKELIGAYAEAVVAACAGDEEDANAALSVRFGQETAPALVVLQGGRYA